MATLIQNPPHAQHGEGDQPKAGGGVSGSARPTDAARKHARQLRRGMSLPEVLLWRLLCREQIGFKFRRQHPVGLYVLDFYCAELHLAIEVDGISHDMGDRPARDVKRDAWLGLHGVEVLRIPAADVLRDATAVADSLARLLDARSKPLHRPAGGPPPHAARGEDKHNPPHASRGEGDHAKHGGGVSGSVETIDHPNRAQRR